MSDAYTRKCGLINVMLLYGSSSVYTDYLNNWVLIEKHV
jgi:hypothetical protein